MAVNVRTFKIVIKGSDESLRPFSINSEYTRNALSVKIAELELTTGNQHKTLNIIPEFPILPSTSFAPSNYYCHNGLVIALHCIVTF